MDNRFRDLVRAFKALADENRLKMLALVWEGQLRCECMEDGCDETRCMNDLVRSLGISQATVSHHIKELVTAGLVTTQKKGRWVYCQVDREGVTRLREFLDGFIKMQGHIKEAYGKIAANREDCGCGTCGCDTEAYARSVGYSEDDLRSIPDEANLGLGCGNPTALAGLKEGETVLDLGSGGGLDCFLAASRVGPNGRVIGVDMTPEMVQRATDTAKTEGMANVEFRLGEIENIPVEDNSVDVVISNCVINLSTDKPRVFREIHRVLKPGGRVAVSDIALLKELPESVRESIKAYVGCVAGAIQVDEYRKAVEASGLMDAKVTVKGASPCTAAGTQDPIGKRIIEGLADAGSLDECVVSVHVEGRK